MSSTTLYQVAAWPIAKHAMLAERDLRLKMNDPESAAETEREIALVESQNFPSNVLFEIDEYFGDTIRYDWLRSRKTYRAVVVRYICSIDREIRASETDVYSYANAMYVHSNAA